MARAVGPVWVLLNWPFRVPAWVGEGRPAAQRLPRRSVQRGRGFCGMVFLARSSLLDQWPAFQRWLPAPRTADTEGTGAEGASWESPFALQEEEGCGRWSEASLWLCSQKQPCQEPRECCR